MLTAITITIDTKNAAFGDSDRARLDEVGRILSDLVDRIESDRNLPVDLLDVNGNAVGRFAIERTR